MKRRFIVLVVTGLLTLLSVVPAFADHTPPHTGTDGTVCEKNPRLADRPECEGQ